MKFFFRERFFLKKQPSPDDGASEPSATGDPSPTDEAASLSALLLRILAGQDDSFTELHQRLARPLANVALRMLRGHPGSDCDAEDVVQSVFASFWQRTRDAGFHAVLDRNELWKLLATITARKALNRVRGQRAQKRGGGRVMLATDIERISGEPIQLSELAAIGPAQEFGLTCEDLLSELDGDCRTIAMLKTMNHSNREIADLLQCSERKVERKLELTRRIWERHLRPEDPADE